MRAFELVRFYAKLRDKRQICRWELWGERWDYKQNWIRQSDKSFILSFVNPARSPLRGFGSLLTQDINSWLVLFLVWCCLYFRLRPTGTILSAALLLMLLILWNIQPVLMDHFIVTFPLSHDALSIYNNKYKTNIHIFREDTIFGICIFVVFSVWFTKCPLICLIFCLPNKQDQRWNNFLLGVRVCQ